MPETHLNADEFPDLVEWLENGHWHTEFDRTTLARRRPYADSRSIREVTALRDPASDKAVISATVHGNAAQPYHTQVRLLRGAKGWSAAPDCSCPVGFRCKHAAALLEFVSEDPSRILASNEPVLPAQVRHWLREMETAARPKPAPKPRKASSATENRFLAYCIERGHFSSGQRTEFIMRVGTRLKDGGFRIAEGRAGADPSKPPKYMTREDRVITSLYHQRYHNLHLWNDMPFTGEGWDEMLEEIFATGRLYFRDGEGDYLHLMSGPPMPVDAAWEMGADGSARPVLRSADPGLIVLTTRPPRYVNPTTASIGLLESPLPPELLETWQTGPAIPAERLDALSTRVSAIPNATLPAPVAMLTETREATPPQPHLRVHARKLGPKWDQRTYIVGQISFRYLDSPLLTPLRKGAAQSHAGILGSNRVIWPRDFKSEQKMASRFMKAGFIAVSEVISANYLDTAALYSCLPDDLLQSPSLAWITRLESAEMQALQADGWTIAVDPKAGLTAHDATDFFPEIETDPDHGIDWFRFDIAADLNGKRVSLIPVIAAAIRMELPSADAPDLPEHIVVPCENPDDGFIRFPARRLIELVEKVRHLFHGSTTDGPLRIDRLAAASVADTLDLDASSTLRSLAALGRGLKDIGSLPPADLPLDLRADLRPYQIDGYRWLRFLADHGLHGILADDMGLGKTVQTLAHLAAGTATAPGVPSLVIAPTSVVPNWAAEAEKFTPHLKVVTLQGKDRADDFRRIASADLVLTSYPLLNRDFEELRQQDWHCVVLDEAQYIKNPKSISARNACRLRAAHRVCLSGTPMENHLGELWSLMRFLMPGFLADEKTFNSLVRRPIERDRSRDAQLALNRRISPLVLRRTKDQVATELPEKTHILHGIDLTPDQTDLYESVRAAMDKRVRDAIAERGMGQSHIIVLDALLKLRQICCDPRLLANTAARGVTGSAKLDFLTSELLPTLIEEGRRILVFSSFTTMLELIEEHLVAAKIPFLKLTGQSKDRAALVKQFQTGTIPVFLISLKAGGTGLNLTAADTVIHYDPWWNPAAENQATDRAHRLGQTKPVFVHKLVCRGTIEDRILDLQTHKAALVEALLSEETSKLRIDAETLSHLLAPLE
ncbi:MAG: DEAD/DEAH box helicase [Verrucomicrobiota bacterium]